MARPPSAARLPWQFVSTDAADPGLTSALKALEPTFLTSQGGISSVRRIWLDTFDGRLARAGLVLEEVRRGRAVSLELTGTDGLRLTAPGPAPRRPAPASELPAGALRDRVAPIVDIRALLTTGELRSRQREIRVLNGDRKTVARLVVDVPNAAGRAAAPTLLTVTAVRGYQPEAERVAAALAAEPDVARWTRSRQEDAAPDAAAAGQRLHAMTADTSAPAAVATVLAGFRTTLEANVPGLVADIDTEFLHDFRVAVRRARSVVKLTGHVLPEERAGTLAAELKWLGDLTSPTRDLDVYLLGVPAMAAGLRSAQPGDLRPFEEFLRKHRAVELRRLLRGVRSARFRALLAEWRNLEDDSAAGAGAALTAADLARASIGQAHRRVVRLGGRITAGSPAEDLHTLRKRCKELRYLLEIFAPLHDRASYRRVLPVLKVLQQCLGDFQDSEVQSDALRSFAGQMAAEGAAEPSTLLAMGELAAALHTAQLQAREAFDGAFAAFSAPQVQRSFATLDATPGRGAA